ncbi:translation initiation factor IF-2 associated domain-containing protein, partial [Brevundimonas sp.]
MSDENDKTNQGQGAGQGNPGGTPSQSGPRAPLSLKPRAAGSVSTGTVKQSFSHGRSKTVVVETKRRPGAGGPQRPQGFDVARPQSTAQAPRPQGQRPQPAGGALSAEEQEARRRAIALATQANAAKADA